MLKITKQLLILFQKRIKENKELKNNYLQREENIHNKILINRKKLH